MLRMRPSSWCSSGTYSSLPQDGQVGSPSSKHSSQATQTARLRSEIGTRESVRTIVLIIAFVLLRGVLTQRRYQTTPGSEDTVFAQLFRISGRPEDQKWNDSYRPGTASPDQPPTTRGPNPPRRVTASPVADLAC